MVVEKLKNVIVKGTYLYFISLGRLAEIDCRGDPGKAIDNLIGFIERYRADLEKIGKSIKGLKRKEGECLTCSYSKIGLC